MVLLSQAGGGPGFVVKTTCTLQIQNVFYRFRVRSTVFTIIWKGNVLSKIPNPVFWTIKISYRNLQNVPKYHLDCFHYLDSHCSFPEKDKIIFLLIHLIVMENISLTCNFSGRAEGNAKSEFLSEFLSQRNDDRVGQPVGHSEKSWSRNWTMAIICSPSY